MKTPDYQKELSGFAFFLNEVKENPNLIKNYPLKYVVFSDEEKKYVKVKIEPKDITAETFKLFLKDSLTPSQWVRFDNFHDLKKDEKLIRRYIKYCEENNLIYRYQKGDLFFGDENFSNNHQVIILREIEDGYNLILGDPSGFPYGFKGFYITCEQWTKMIKWIEVFANLYSDSLTSYQNDIDEGFDIWVEALKQNEEVFEQIKKNVFVGCENDKIWDMLWKCSCLKNINFEEGWVEFYNSAIPMQHMWGAAGFQLLDGESFTEYKCQLEFEEFKKCFKKKEKWEGEGRKTSQGLKTQTIEDNNYQETIENIRKTKINCSTIQYFFEKPIKTTYEVNWFFEKNIVGYKTNVNSIVKVTCNETGIVEHNGKTTFAIKFGIDKYDKINCSLVFNGYPFKFYLYDFINNENYVKSELEYKFDKCYDDNVKEIFDIQKLIQFIIKIGKRMQEEKKTKTKAEIFDKEYFKNIYRWYLKVFDYYDFDEYIEENMGEDYYLFKSLNLQLSFFEHVLSENENLKKENTIFHNPINNKSYIFGKKLHDRELYPLIYWWHIFEFDSFELRVMKSLANILSVLNNVVTTINIGDITRVVFGVVYDGFLYNNCIDIREFYKEFNMPYDGRKPFEEFVKDVSDLLLNQTEKKNYKSMLIDQFTDISFTKYLSENYNVDLDFINSEKNKKKINMSLILSHIFKKILPEETLEEIKKFANYKKFKDYKFTEIFN